MPVEQLLTRAGVVAALITSLAPEATARPFDTPRLEWRAPEVCPTQAEFVARVERFLRSSLEARRGERITIAVAIESLADQRGFRANIQVDAKRGKRERQLEHDDCEELMEGAALVAAMAIDPNLAVPDEPSETREPAAPPAPPADTSTVSPAVPGLPSAPVGGGTPPLSTPIRKSTSDTALSSVQPVRSPLMRWQTAASAYGLVGNAALPDVGTGLGLRVASGRGHFQGALQGTYWLPRFAGIRGATASGIELQAFAVGARACWLPILGRWTLGACFGPDVGSVVGRGIGLEAARSGQNRFSAFMVDFSTALGGSANGEGLTTELGFGAGAALERPRFGITRDGLGEETFQASTLLVQGYVGLRYVFGATK